MNPLKSAFGVSLEKFLGFLVHQWEIELDPTKTKAIATFTPLATLKEFGSFVRKVSYLRRFTLGMAEILKPLLEQTKKGIAFV